MVGGVVELGGGWEVCFFFLVPLLPKMNRYTSTSTYVYECLFFFFWERVVDVGGNFNFTAACVFFFSRGGFFIFNVVYVEKLKICTHIVLFQKI